MRRYWLSAESYLGNGTEIQQVQISGESFHHIFGVCRQGVGSHFEVLGAFDPIHQTPLAFLVEVTQVGKNSALAKIKESRPLPPTSKPEITLALSVSRYQVMDAVVEKAVELGVETFVPFFSDFSFVRKDNTFPLQKLERWEKIVISATQQSGRGSLMKIEAPQSLEAVLKKHLSKDRLADTLPVFAFEGESPLSLQQYLEDKKHYQKVLILVGSEGGFSQTEVQFFNQLQIPAVSLGEQVLRVETACISLCSILKYELGGHHGTKRGI